MQIQLLVASLMTDDVINATESYYQRGTHGESAIISVAI